jgi:hypothetical protein
MAGFENRVGVFVCIGILVLVFGVFGVYVALLEKLNEVNLGDW